MKKILLMSLLFYVCNYSQAPSVPSGLLSFSYEKHIELEWNPNAETNLAGYRIYKWNGLGYTLSASVTYEKNDFIEFISQAGTTNYYKISAYNGSGFESAMSDSVSAAIKSMTDD
jgi:fibronectin type 3 domain-containing protein